MKYNEVHETGCQRRQAATCECTQCDCVQVTIIFLHACVTLFDLLRGIVHTFFYEYGLDQISGLATGDLLCDSRLSILMIGYGGANLESFLLRLYALYVYVTCNRAICLMRVTCLAPVLWLVAPLVVALGEIDVGDADVPGTIMMYVRAAVSLFTFVMLYL